MVNALVITVYEMVNDCAMSGRGAGSARLAPTQSRGSSPRPTQCIAEAVPIDGNGGAPTSMGRECLLSAPPPSENGRYQAPGVSSSGMLP